MSKCRKLLLGLSFEIFSLDVFVDVVEFFVKKFFYGKLFNNEWQLLDVSEIFICDYKEFNVFFDLKNFLNEVKNLLSDKKLDEWYEYIVFINKVGKIIFYVRKFVNVEFCT